MKHAILNREFGEVRTIIVLGVGRGGTSLIAGCLRALGMCMGPSPHPLKHEWSPVIYRPDGKIDLPATHRAVQQMDSVYQKWGWKSPRDVFQLESVLPLLRAPGFIVVTRDLLEASLSGLTYQDVPLYLSLDETALAYRAITTRLRYWPWPALIVPFAEALRHPQELVELLCSFLGLQPEESAKMQAVNFIQPGGNAYRRFDARPGDAPVLTSPEDLRSDRENLATDYSARFGKEYARQFDNALAESQKIVANASPSTLEKTATELRELMSRLPEALPAKGKNILSSLRQRFGGSRSEVEMILRKLAAAAEEAKRRLHNRAIDSGYEDLTRLFAVLQVTIRVRHALQRAVLADELEVAPK